jgi:Putative transposase
MTAVLHTLSRQLNYHPHIHAVMPAAVMLQQQTIKTSCAMACVRSSE